MTEQFLKQYADAKGFSPCQYCGNILTKECLHACIVDGEYQNFVIRTGIEVSEMEDFPIQEILESTDPRYRLVSMAIYIKVLFDNLKYRHEFEFREKAKNMEVKVDLKAMSRGGNGRY